MDISRETFVASDGDTRELILFDSIKSLTHEVRSYVESNEVCHTDLNNKIKKSGRVNKALSGGGGIIGGFLSVLGLKIFG